MKTRTVVLALCLVGTPAWAPAGGDVDAKPIDPASNQRVQKAIDQRSDDIVRPKRICTRETPTGSHRRITVCRSVAQIEDERVGAKEYMRQMEHENSRIPPPDHP